MIPLSTIVKRDASQISPPLSSSIMTTVTPPLFSSSPPLKRRVTPFPDRKTSPKHHPTITTDDDDDDIPVFVAPHKPSFRRYDHYSQDQVNKLLLCTKQVLVDQLLRFRDKLCESERRRYIAEAKRKAAKGKDNVIPAAAAAAGGLDKTRLTPGNISIIATGKHIHLPLNQTTTTTTTTKTTTLLDQDNQHLGVNGNDGKAATKNSQT